MRVLVSGAGGYLGSRVIADLAGRGFEVIAAARTRIEGYQSVQMDLRFPFENFKILEQIRPDAVVALAYMRTDAANANPQMALVTDIAGMNALFDACSTLGVPRVVYASSINVYGIQADFGDSYVTEATHGRPRTLYGWMKQLNEAFAEHYNATSRTQFVGVRFSGIHGDGKRGGFDPFDRVVYAAGHRDAATLPWSSALEISFRHVKDSARMIGELVAAPATKWSIYNSGGDVLTMAALARLAQELAGIKVTCTEPGGEILAVSRVDSSRLHNEFAIREPTIGEWLQREIAGLR
jgi:nucleoside-diphosphate-sugar epimerase